MLVPGKAIKIYWNFMFLFLHRMAWKHKGNKRALSWGYFNMEVPLSETLLKWVPMILHYVAKRLNHSYKQETLNTSKTSALSNKACLWASHSLGPFSPKVTYLLPGHEHKSRIMEFRDWGLSQERKELWLMLNPYRALAMFSNVEVNFL